MGILPCCTICNRGNAYNFGEYILQKKPKTMNKITISRSRPLFKYVTFLITLFCLYVVVVNFKKDMGTVVAAGVIAILSFIASYREYYAVSIEFDDDNMYVSNKKFNGQIPLKRIAAINLTSNRVNQSHYWDIIYKDAKNDEHTLQILPKNKNFALFREKLKERNPDVEIKDSIFF
jgi:hypothetical protein